MNRFKGLNIVNCLKNYGQRSVILYWRQQRKPSPQKNKRKKAKWLSEEALLKKAKERREVKSKGESKISN